jgi:hypothetical protein
MKLDSYVCDDKDNLTRFADRKSQVSGGPVVRKRWSIARKFAQLKFGDPPGSAGAIVT